MNKTTFITIFISIFFIASCQEKSTQIIKSNNNITADKGNNILKAKMEIANIIPITSSVGKTETFTISGSNLPDNLQVELEDCNNYQKLSQTDSKLQFTCIGNSMGEKTFKLIGTGNNQASITITIEAGVTDKGGIITEYTAPLTMTNVIKASKGYVTLRGIGVEGLAYKYKNSKLYTQKDGLFLFEGEGIKTLTFQLGQVTLPKNIQSVNESNGEIKLANSTTAISVNWVRFIEFLDEDKNLTNGIRINSITNTIIRDYNFSGVDFSLEYDQTNQQDLFLVDPLVAGLIEEISGGEHITLSDYLSVQERLNKNSLTKSNKTQSINLETKYYEGVFVNLQGLPVQGLEYYAGGEKGVTDNLGKFKYQNGSSILFKIRSFTLGSADEAYDKVTPADLAPTQSAEHYVARNINSLLSKLDANEGDPIINIDTNVYQVFDLYPNAINTIIDLTQSDGQLTTEQKNSLSQTQKQDLSRNYFEEQFDDFNTAGEIISDIQALRQSTNNQPNTLRGFNKMSMNSLNTFNQNTLSPPATNGDHLKALLKGVDKFHMFNSMYFAYGYFSAGNSIARNIIPRSNRAFSVFSTRNDLNYWIPFGEKTAWKVNGFNYRPYQKDEISNNQIDLVNKKNTSFNLPFISAGKYGQGRVLAIGNQAYTAVLTRPYDFSWDKPPLRYTATATSMIQFFHNTFEWLSQNKYNKMGSNIKVLTNFNRVVYPGQTSGEGGDFNANTINSIFKIDLEYKNMYAQTYASFDPTEYPVMILQDYQHHEKKWDDNFNLSEPRMNNKNVTAIIEYVKAGGSVLIMQTTNKGQEPNVYRPLDQLLNVASLAWTLTGDQKIRSPNHASPFASRKESSYVYEKFVGEEKKIYETSGSSYDYFSYLDKAGEKLELIARGKTEKELREKLQAKLSQTDNTNLSTEEVDTLKLCTDNTFHYEINCIEFRPGDGVVETVENIETKKHGQDYHTVINLTDAYFNAMAKSAKVGDNLDKLYQHELHYRTNGREGKKLTLEALTSTYNNVSVWLWNSVKFTYDANHEDTNNFKSFVMWLNCYTNQQHSTVSGTECPTATMSKLKQVGMLIEKEGVLVLNPSYSLNYAYYPLTRIMLGRSFDDLEIKTDVSQYPGDATGVNISENFSIYLKKNVKHGSAGNIQSTGYYAPAHQTITITAPTGVDVAKLRVQVAFADNLVGRAKHEIMLKRPPQVSKRYSFDSNSKQVTIIHPYGGLIYILSNLKNVADDYKGTFTISGQIAKAIHFKLGETTEAQWNTMKQLKAPLAELESQYFVVTTRKENLANYSFAEIVAHGKKYDTFSEYANEFYGFSENDNTIHGKITHPTRYGHKHRIVNDIQISIGFAHSGYPVMSTDFSARGSDPVSPFGWLLAHEIGHNLATKWLNIQGAVEITNNIFAQYVQDKSQPSKLNSLKSSNSLKLVPTIVADSHSWAKAKTKGLVFFIQLKEWIENHPEDHDLFNNTEYYDANKKPKVSWLEGNGWDLYKILHREARDSNGKEPLCRKSTSPEYKDYPIHYMLVMCVSALTKRNLFDYASKWELAEAMSVVDGAKFYSAAFNDAFKFKINSLGYSLPITKIENITNYSNSYYSQ